MTEGLVSISGFERSESLLREGSKNGAAGSSSWRI